MHDWIDNMTNSLQLPSGMIISYELVRSKVKNINMRIYPDGRIRISAASKVSRRQIEDFICSKERFLLKALARTEENREGGVPQDQAPVTEEQKAFFRTYILGRINEIFPKFGNYNIQKPEVDFRDMKSRWGSCCKAKGWVHFSYRLLFQSLEFTEYVIVHELTHLVEPSHSPAFYQVVADIMPDWREKKATQKHY